MELEFLKEKPINLNKERLYKDIKTKNIFKNINLKKIINTNNFYIKEDTIVKTWLTGEDEQYIELKNAGQMKCSQVPLRRFLRTEENDKCTLIYHNNELLMNYLKEVILDDELTILLKK